MKLVDQTHPNLVVPDLMLPMVKGLDVCRICELDRLEWAIRSLGKNMVHSLRFRLLLALMAVVMVAVGTVAFFISQVTMSEFQRYVERDLERTNRLTNMIQSYYNYSQSQNTANVPTVVKQMEQILGERVIITDAAGKVTADSMQQLVGQTLALDSSIPAVVITVGQQPFVGAPVNGRIEFSAIELNQPGAFRAPLPIAIRSPYGPGRGPIESAFISSVNRSLLLAVSITGIVALLLSMVLSRRILGPIEVLTAAVRNMEKGDLKQRVQVQSKDEIGELTHAFNAMADGLVRVDQLRRNMVTDVAHELRTPLTNIRGYLEAVRDGMVQPSLPLIESLHEEAMLLNRLIDDLQELALAEAGQLRLICQRVSIQEIVEKAVTAQQPLMLDKSLTVDVELAPNLPVIEADAERIGQVIRNLLNNAIRYTPAGGSITVTATSTGSEVQVSVRDTGVGIAAEHLPYIFERFFRTDRARARATGGAGLGLTIVKQLVQGHGGRVWAESTLGVGSVFTFTLPVP